MDVFFYCCQGFEKWDYRSPSQQGIGGSETCAVEMSWRLARRGIPVTVYAPVPEDCPSNWRGTTWLPVEAAVLNWYGQRSIKTPGLWVVHRSPGAADLFEDPAQHGQELFHVSQDVVYSESCGGEYTPERMAKFTRVIALCPAHRDYLAAAYPFMAEKLCIGSNGIKTDDIKMYEPLPRDPKRLIWASSPDRGLEALLHIFHRAREFDPGLSLRVAYGFDNWDIHIAANPGCPQEAMKANIMRLMDQPGVQWLGRIPQPQLHQEFLQAGIWPYSTTFEETSCVACMEAQALGAIPVTNHYWAVRDNVQFGVKIPGDPLNDPLCRARYVQEIVALANDPDRQAAIRKPMQKWAQKHFDWEVQVDQWLAWAKENPTLPQQGLA